MYDALTGTPPDQGALGGDILQQIDAHLERLLQCRAEVGARSDRLTSTEQRLKNEHIYLRELRSKIEDIDMAELITEFTMQQNAYYAALSTGASMIYPSLVDFLR
jgi:flagellar hook-associated protein 3 FlgL